MNKTLIKTVGTLINFISFFSPYYAAKLAVKLFSTPRKGKLNTAQENYLKSTIHQTFTYNGINIKTYRWEGTKDTILLVHGWESNSSRWKDLITLLKNTQDYNIIAVDAPAHGASGSKIFNAILYSECINLISETFNPSIIIGHSIGGTASALAINNYKLSTEKLILLGAPSNFDKVIETFVKIMGFNKRVINAINDYYLKHFGTLPKFYNIENFSENLKAKGLIVHDKKDRIISYIDALHIAKHYKNATLVKTVGFGHGLKSEKVYNHILEFLND